MYEIRTLWVRHTNLNWIVDHYDNLSSSNSIVTRSKINDCHHELPNQDQSHHGLECWTLTKLEMRTLWPRTQNFTWLLTSMTKDFKHFQINVKITFTLDVKTQIRVQRIRNICFRNLVILFRIFAIVNYWS